MVYKKKIGRIKIKTLEGKEKKIALDENYTVGQLMVKICKDIGKCQQHTATQHIATFNNTQQDT